MADLFEAACDRVPDREALVCGGERRSYAELEQNANRFAHFLRDAGVAPGDHVGIYGFNSVQWVEAALAVFKIRAVPINVNYRYVEAELRYLFDDSKIVALVHDRRFAPRIQAIASALTGIHRFVSMEDGSRAAVFRLGSTSYADALAKGSPVRDFAERSGDDLYVIYTGGTTGMPKGVVWRQEDVIFALGGGIDLRLGKAQKPEDMTARISADGASVIAPLAPLMHGAAQWIVLGALFTGNKAVLIPGSFDARTAWQLVEDEGIGTLVLTGDATARPLIEIFDGEHPEWDLSSLQVVTSSAAVLSDTVKQKLLDRFPGLLLIDSTGASEQGFTGMTVVTRDSLSTPEAPNTAASGRRFTPGPDVGVFDEDGRRVEAGSGRHGFIARSGNVPVGYFNAPEKTAATFVEREGRRWAIPGDYATVDADGSIVLLGRGSSCINSGGEKIFAEEVEQALKAHPAILDVLAVGVPDERFGSRVAAVVQLRAGASVGLAEVDAHCRKLIAGYKVPRELHVTDSIQRSPSGKPDYAWAREVTRSGSFLV